MGVPIITYHALGDVSSPLWTPVEVFETHLKAFAQSGYQTLPLAKLVKHLHRAEPIPESALVLTFDDGYQSVYREAWPRLRSWNFGATVFLIADYCGHDNQWPTQMKSTPAAPLITWDQVVEMASEGCEFGAHSCSHPPLHALTPSQAEEEIVISKEHIQKYTGQAVESFAFPYGKTESFVTDLVRQHFSGAASAYLGLVQSHSDPYFLPRIDSCYLTPDLVPHLRGTMFQNYLRQRQWLRSIRRFFYPDWQRRQLYDRGSLHLTHRTR